MTTRAQQAGLRLEDVPDKTRLYLEFHTLVNSRAVGLLDHPTLLRELRGLERRPGTSGRDRVDHRRGAHDDFANVAAGACVMATLLAAQPDAPPNVWGREEYADVRRAFPGLDLIAWSEGSGRWQTLTPQRLTNGASELVNQSASLGSCSLGLRQPSGMPCWPKL